MKKTILFSCLIFSSQLLAEHYAQTEWQLSPTLSYETNALGSLTNIGLKWGGDPRYTKYIELVSNLSFFTPGRQFSPDTAFTNLDMSVRFGLFSDINAYAEVGVALDELFVDGGDGHYFYNDGYNAHYQYNDHRNSSKADWFVGVGGGWQMDWLTVNVYGRYRYLESLTEQYWLHNFDPRQNIPHQYQWFTGLELSVNF